VRALDFAIGSPLADAALAVLEQPDGKLLVVGSLQSGNLWP